MYIVAINIYPEVFFMEELLNFSSNNGTKVKVDINSEEYLEIIKHQFIFKKISSFGYYSALPYFRFSIFRFFIQITSLDLLGISLFICMYLKNLTVF